MKPQVLTYWTSSLISGKQVLELTRINPVRVSHLILFQQNDKNYNCSRLQVRASPTSAVAHCAFFLRSIPFPICPLPAALFLAFQSFPSTGNSSPPPVDFLDFGDGCIRNDVRRLLIGHGLRDCAPAPFCLSFSYSLPVPLSCLSSCSCCASSAFPCTVRK